MLALVPGESQEPKGEAQEQIPRAIRLESPECGPGPPGQRVEFQLEIPVGSRAKVQGRIPAIIRNYLWSPEL